MSALPPHFSKEFSLTPISDFEFKKLAELAASIAGLTFPEGKKALVQSRVSKRLRALGLKSFDEYIRFAQRNPEQENDHLISVLTTNVTSFYREVHHFDFMKSEVFAPLRTQLLKGDPVRIWSAGCSTGQEPYTIAMEASKAVPNIADKDFKILATDIDKAILAQAASGKYLEMDIEGIPASLQKKFLQRQGNRFEVSKSIKDLVTFEALNLHDHWPMRDRFDVIFCRNVVIYFDDDKKSQLWPRFNKMLKPGGYLMLGHSERIHPIAGSGFKSVGVTSYKKT